MSPSTEDPASASTLSTPPVVRMPEMLATDVVFASAVILVVDEVPAVAVETARSFKLQQVAASIEQLPQVACTSCRRHNLSQRVAFSEAFPPIVLYDCLYDYPLGMITRETTFSITSLQPLLSLRAKSRHARDWTCGRQAGCYDSCNAREVSDTARIWFLFLENYHKAVSQHARQRCFVGSPGMTSPMAASPGSHHARQVSTSGLYLDRHQPTPRLPGMCGSSVLIRQSTFVWKPPWASAGESPSPFRYYYIKFEDKRESRSCRRRSGRQGSRLQSIRGVGYVVFESVESVPAALQLTGQRLREIPVIVQLAEAEKNHQPRAETASGAHPNQVPFHRLYVGNIHFSITEEDLKNVFQPFGELEFVQHGLGRAVKASMVWGGSRGWLAGLTK